MKNRTTEDSDQNKTLNYLVINYNLNYTDHIWVGSDTDQERKRELLMNASYICMKYGYSLRGYEGFWVDSQCLMDGIHLRKHDRREPHMLVVVMGVFKGEYVNRIHILPLNTPIAVTNM